MTEKYHSQIENEASRNGDILMAESPMRAASAQEKLFKERKDRYFICILFQHYFLCCLLTIHLKIAIQTDCQLIACHRFLPAFPFLLKFLAISVCHGQYLTIFAGKPVIITYFQSYNPLIITTGKPDDF